MTVTKLSGAKNRIWFKKKQKKQTWYKIVPQFVYPLVLTYFLLKQEICGDLCLFYFIISHKLMFLFIIINYHNFPFSFAFLNTELE